MNVMRDVLRAPLMVLIVVGLGARALAGDFTPPTGPVGPTMKTLDSVEPRIPVSQDTTPGDASGLYVISQTGSYYLTQNITGVAGKNGIKIMAAGVTLDLNGFTMTGVPSSGSAITTGSSAANLHVTNGRIVGWSAADIDASSSTDSSFDNLDVEAAGGVGLLAGGPASIRDCSARSCTTDGFNVSGSAVFTRCEADDNIYGFVVTGQITADHCTADGNAGGGFSVAAGTLNDCRADNNSGDGFDVGLGGIDTEVIISHCFAINNDNGFSVGSSPGRVAMLDHCLAKANATDGFHLLWAADVDSCASQGNGDDGFQLAPGCDLTGCVSNGNNYGIYDPTTGDDARIDSCTAHANSVYGYLIEGARTLAVRNEGRSNTNADFYFTSTVQSGPVVSTQGTISSTNPWANFGSTVIATATAPNEPRITTKDAAARQEIEALPGATAPIEGSAHP